MPSNPDENLRIYRHRSLPHWEAGGSTYFLTFRSLIGPLPDHARDFLVRLLPAIRPDWVLIELGMVMPDHVHLILTPLPAEEGRWHALGLIMQALKGVGSRQVNLLMGRRGTLWQKESCDHLIRNQQDWDEQARYIWDNPVRSGEVADNEDSRWMIIPPQ